MVTVQCKSTNNKSQGNMLTQEPNSHIIGIPGCLKTVEAQENDLKPNLIKMIESFKEKNQ